MFAKISDYRNTANSRTLEGKSKKETKKVLKQKIASLKNQENDIKELADQIRNSIKNGSFDGETNLSQTQKQELLFLVFEIPILLQEVRASRAALSVLLGRLLKELRKLLNNRRLVDLKKRNLLEGEKPELWFEVISGQDTNEIDQRDQLLRYVDTLDMLTELKIESEENALETKKRRRKKRFFEMFRRKPKLTKSELKLTKQILRLDCLISEDDSEKNS